MVGRRRLRRREASCCVAAILPEPRATRRCCLLTRRAGEHHAPRGVPRAPHPRLLQARRPQRRLRAPAPPEPQARTRALLREPRPPAAFFFFASNATACSSAAQIRAIDEALKEFQLREYKTEAQVGPSSTPIKMRKRLASQVFEPGALGGLQE